MSDDRPPAKKAYDRVRAEFPGGGERARDAFYRYLAEEEKKAGQDGPASVRLNKGSPVPMTAHGKFRVYFNRHGAEPLMWCVSPEAGDWEIAVRDVQLATIAESVYRKKETADEDDGRPSAWFSVERCAHRQPRRLRHDRGSVSPPCDYHRCWQCSETPESFGDDTFRASTVRTTRGRRVIFSLRGTVDPGDWSPAFAREIARRLLDAAEECEDLDWQERDK